MKIAVIIPTQGRPAILARLLAHLGDQERRPDQIFVSVPDESHLPEIEAIGFPLSPVTGGGGLAAQRNRALDLARDGFDIVTFFDDDFLPAKHYLRQLEECFAALDDVAAIVGHVAVDGARGVGLTFDEGLMILRAAEASTSMPNAAVDLPGTFGCNMSMRVSAIGTLRFDERLVLYGWQEDIDFTGQLRSRGRVVKVPSLIGVHLGAEGGRISGVRFGYSQIVNPTYLIRKGTIPIGYAVKLIARSVATNVTRSLWSEPPADRLGRLRGNLIGAYHLMRGRVEPEHVLKL